MKKKQTNKKIADPAAEEVKSVSRIVDGADARVLINVYSPGHEPKEFRVNVPNIVGTANLLHRSPESIAAEIISGLRAKYGDRVG